MTRGLQPSRVNGGAPNSTGTTAYRVSNAYGTTMAQGDPVMLSNGTVVRAANGDITLGVAAGFEWIDPVTRLPVYSRVFPASTSSGGLISGDNRPICHVYDNPDQIYTIDARVSLAVSALNIGALYTVSLGTPNVQAGFSNAVLDATTVSIDASMVRVIGLSQVPNNALNVSGNEVQVVLSRHLFNL